MSEERAPDPPVGFRRSAGGGFFVLDGAHRPAGRERSRQKLCFACIDRELLVDLLRELAADPLCQFVKCSIAPRGGVYVGRAVFASDQRVGELWRELRGHAGVICTVQDDGFTMPFRASRATPDPCPSRKHGNTGQDPRFRP